MLITKTITINENDNDFEFGIKKLTADKFLTLVNQILNALHVTPEILAIDKNDETGANSLASIRQLIYNMLNTGIEVENDNINDVQLNTPLLDFIITNALTNPNQDKVLQIQTLLVQCVYYDGKNIKLNDLIGLIKKPINLWNLFINITKHCLEEFFVKK